MRKTIQAAIAVAAIHLNVATCIAGPFGFGGKDEATARTPGTVTATEATSTSRAKTLLGKNPLSQAWTALRQPSPEDLREQAAKRYAEQQQHDPLSLANMPKEPTPGLLIAAAKISERQGNYELARQQFHRGLSAAPMHLDGLLAFARMEDRLGNMQTAEMLYRQAVGINPHNPTTLNDLALCLARAGKLPQSAGTLQQAIDVKPDKPLYRNNIATVLIELNRDREALAHLSAVHGPAVANFNVGHLLVERGRTEQAVPYLAAALEIDPQFSQARMALAALGIGPVENSQVASQSSQMPAVVPPPTAPTGPNYGRPSRSEGFPPATNPRTAMPAGATPAPSASAAWAPPVGDPRQATKAPDMPFRQLPPVH